MLRTDKRALLFESETVRLYYILPIPQTQRDGPAYSLTEIPELVAGALSLLSLSLCLSHFGPSPHCCLQPGIALSGVKQARNTGKKQHYPLGTATAGQD